MDKTFSPSYSLSQVAYVEAEAVEFLRFRFHISGVDPPDISSASSLLPGCKL